MADGYDDPREELIDLLTAEMRRIQTALLELKGHIEQTQNVVNREQQRNTDLGTELRTVQDNIDTIPRQDIRAKYDEAMDARFRLSTMRGQLEKFQSNEELLTEQQTLLGQILSKLQGTEILSTGRFEHWTGGSGAGRRAPPPRPPDA